MITALLIIERIDKVGEPISFYMGRTAGWAYLACALYITFDVVSRRFFGFSSQATVEIGGYLLALGTTWALADALSARAHIRVDVLVNRMPKVIRAYLHALALMFLFVFSVMLTERSWAVFALSWGFGSIDHSSLAIPLVIPQVFWALGFTMFSIGSGLLLLRTILMLALGRREEVDLLLGSNELAAVTQVSRDILGPNPGG